MNLYVGSAYTNVPLSPEMCKVPTITGGGAGFSSTGTTAKNLVILQTSAAITTLVLEAEY